MKLVRKYASMNDSNRRNISVKRLASIAVFGLIAPMVVTTSATAVELLKFMVSESGMQRVHYEDLPADFDLRGLKHNKFNILADGQAIEIFIKGQDSSVGRTRFFGPGAYIEFYGEAADSLYSDEKAYSLHYMTNRELREFGRPRIEDDRTRVNSRAVPSTVYSHTHIVEEDNYYDFAAPSKVDPWHFGQNFSIFPTPTHTFELSDVVNGSTSATVSADVYGLVDFDIEGNDHHYEVVVNDITLGDQQFDGNAIDTLTTENAVVNEGSNTFKYNFRPIAEVPFDILALNRFSVTYPRYTKAIDNVLDGEFGADHTSVSGIDDGAFSVYRVDDSRSDSAPDISLLSRAIRSADGAVVFSAGNQPGRFIVVGDGGHKTPRVQKLLVEDNIKAGQAEYLVIAHSALMGNELDQLVELRSERYSVKVVDVAQIYSQFGDGVPHPDAIRAYIKYAADNLDTRFVTLIGNDTYDYKGQGGTGSISLIPTPYLTTPGGLLLVTQTPSDASYGDLDLDGVPDLPIGRISARTKAELQAVVNKLIAYESRTDYAGRVLVAADKEDSGNGISFTQDAEALIEAMPESWSASIRTDFRAFPDVDGGQLAHDKTIAAINAGVSVVNFIGHSSHRRWSFSSPPVLQSSEIAAFTNVDKPALVTQWGCWNSYYVDPAGNTMADEFLVGGENGAATVLGASTLTSSAGERALGIELNRRMFTEGLTIGEAVIQAKQALALEHDFPAIQAGWQIIGDPALMVDPF